MIVGAGTQLKCDIHDCRCWYTAVSVSYNTVGAGRCDIHDCNCWYTVVGVTHMTVGGDTWL